MSVSEIYAIRALPRDPIAIIVNLLETSLKSKTVYRRPILHMPPRGGAAINSNWRSNVLAEVARKVREKDDPDYDEINASINKVSKQNYAKIVESILNKLTTRDAMFRLRVTTLLFDRGIRQNCYAPILADAYRDISKKNPDALVDLSTQIGMFDTLYDVSKVVIVPPSTDPTFNDAIIAWTKQKETKRGFAVYTSELFSRGLLADGIMQSMVSQVGDDLKESVRLPKTPQGEEHVDHLVRFLAAIVPKVAFVKPLVADILKIPRTETPCLCMKSRFKLEDAAK
ncbi:MAG: hypothetical protein EBY32_07430 [Proteobacteria bacterium]|nr:hypothetical protein [Pseudomonadota bacterium]